jgi:hypothetical protein
MRRLKDGDTAGTVLAESMEPSTVSEIKPVELNHGYNTATLLQAHKSSI